MNRWLKFLMAVSALAGPVTPLALAQLMEPDRIPYRPPRLWHLTVSYCDVDHCTDYDRAPNYWKYEAFETGEECVAKIKEVTKGQSREMARHRILACALKFEDPGLGDSQRPGDMNPEE
jgi:hypothetical protein